MTKFKYWNKLGRDRGDGEMKGLQKTDRLVVRTLDKRDYAAWVEYWSSMKNSKNEWDLARKKDRDLSRSAFAKVLKTQKTLRDQDKFYDFSAFRKKDGKIVGGVALMDLSRGVFHNAYLGYSMSNLFWGQGYGKEAVKACIEIGFKQLGLHRIEAGIAPSNKRSIALAKSLKMRKEGRKVRALFLDNKWQDIMVYALTCEDVGLKFKGQKPLLQQNRR